MFSLRKYEDRLNDVFSAKILLFASVTGIPYLNGWMGRAMKVTRGVRLSGPFSFHSDYGLKDFFQENAFYI